MIFIACLMAGAIGAAFTGGLDPNRSFSGSTNIGLGLLGGTLSWTSVTEILALDQTLGTFLTILMFGAICGALVTMGLASLRNILTPR